MKNTDPNGFPIHKIKLIKGQKVTNLKENKTYIVCDFGKTSIRLIAEEGNKLCVLLKTGFRPEEWRVEDNQ